MEHGPEKKSKHRKDGEQKDEDLYKQYHPAFCAAMTQIFEHDICKYDYKSEYSLNSLPNRIDLLVIKKGTGSVSEKGIGKIFRKYNLFEYKSPGQSLGIREYHTAIAYASLYAAHMRIVRPEELTVSFVREGKPKKLLDYFETFGFRITEPEQGIYVVRKDGHIDMQVLVTRELGEEYIWLKALSKKLEREDAERLSEEAKKERDPLGKARIRTILDLASRLNQDKTWMKEDGIMGIRDLFKEEFEERDQKIAEQKKKIRNLNRQLKRRDTQLQNKDEQLQSKDEQLQNQNEQLQSKDEQLQTERKEISRLQEENEKLRKLLGTAAVL